MLTFHKTLSVICATSYNNGQATLKRSPALFSCTPCRLIAARPVRLVSINIMTGQKSFLSWNCVVVLRTHRLTGIFINILFGIRTFPVFIVIASYKFASSHCDTSLWTTSPLRVCNTLRAATSALWALQHRPIYRLWIYRSPFMPTMSAYYEIINHPSVALSVSWYYYSL